jgi:hypothetical protein
MVYQVDLVEEEVVQMVLQLLVLVEQEIPLQQVHHKEVMEEVQVLVIHMQAEVVVELEEWEQQLVVHLQMVVLEE